MCRVSNCSLSPWVPPACTGWHRVPTHRVTPGHPPVPHPRRGLSPPKSLLEHMGKAGNAGWELGAGSGAAVTRMGVHRGSPVLSQGLGGVSGVRGCVCALCCACVRVSLCLCVPGAGIWPRCHRDSQTPVSPLAPLSPVSPGPGNPLPPDPAQRGSQRRQDPQSELSHTRRHDPRQAGTPPEATRPLLPPRTPRTPENRARSCTSIPAWIPLSPNHPPTAGGGAGSRGPPKLCCPPGSHALPGWGRGDTRGGGTAAPRFSSLSPSLVFPWSGIGAKTSWFGANWEQGETYTRLWGQRGTESSFVLHRVGTVPQNAGFGSWAGPKNGGFAPKRHFPAPRLDETASKGLGPGRSPRPEELHPTISILPQPPPNVGLWQGQSTPKPPQPPCPCRILGGSCSHLAILTLLSTQPLSGCFNESNECFGLFFFFLIIGLVCWGVLVFWFFF